MKHETKRLPQGGEIHELRSQLGEANDEAAYAGTLQDQVAKLEDEVEMLLRDRGQQDRQLAELTHQLSFPE